MGKNNPLRDMTPQRRNYKLYKAKKQWFTACATFLVALGAMAATSTVQAAPQPSAGAPTTAVTSAAAPSATSGVAKKPVNGSSAASPTNTSRARAADETESVTNHSAAARSANAPSTSSAAMTNSAASFVLAQPEASNAAHSSTASSAVASTSTTHSTATSSTATKKTSSASKSSATMASAASSAANTTSAAMSSATSSATSSAESSAAASSTASLAVNRTSLAHITSANAGSGATSAEIAASLIRSQADHPEARSAETVTANYVDDHGNTTVETVSVPVNSAGSYSYTAVAPSGYILVNRAQTTYSGSASGNLTITIHLRKTEQRHYNVIEVLPDGTHKTLLSLTTTIVQRPDGSWGALDVRKDGSADSNSGTHNTYMNQNSLIIATEPSGNNNQGQPYVNVTPNDASWYTFNPDSFSGETAQVSSSADYSQGIGFDHNAGDGFFFDLFSGAASVSNVLPSTNFIISYHTDSSTHPDNVSFVTYTFVDDNEGGAQVGDPVTVSGTNGETVNTGLTIPTNYQLASGQTPLPGTVRLPATSSNITIHLTHKITHLAVAKTETRTITVHFVNGKTGQPMGSLAPDAVIEAYYSCPGEKDLVTGTVTLDRVPGTNECAYSWDSAAGDTATPGWHIISGDWGHKLDNGGNGGNWIAGMSAADTTPDRTILSVKIPDVPGYSAVTHGDWTWRSDASTTASGAPQTATSVIGADEFVWPGWGQPGEETYTPHGRYYEVLNEHTVYFLPNQDGQQTVTNHFTKWENGAAGSSAASDASINVYYENPVNPSSVGNDFGNPSYTGSFATSGSSNAADWKTSYGDNWRWAKDAGSAATPGFATSDGRWSGLGSSAAPASGSYGTPLPVVNGYTAISTKIDGTSTNSYANPASVAAPAFTQSSGATTWTASAKSSTTYYVPDSDLTKAITRTINVTDPITHATTSTAQTVTFNRTARVNNSDNAVVFGADVGGHFVSGPDVWSSVTDHNGTTLNTTGTTPTGDWAAVNIAKSGYTAFINSVATSNAAIADTPVTSDTQGETDNVTYVQNVADITINHASVSQVFTGRAATIPSGITNSVSASASGLTLPSGASSVVLDDGDYSWQHVNADGSTSNLLGAPTAVGNYCIILNSTGLSKFQRLSSNYLWNYDPARSFVQYTITPATTTDTVSATLSGSAAMSYSGTAPTLTNLQSGTIKVTLAFPGATDADNTYTLHDGDYTWETTDGSAPTTVGHYTLQLTSAAAARIQAAINSAVGAGNVTFAATNLSGSAQFDINQARYGIL